MKPQDCIMETGPDGRLTPYIVSDAGTRYLLSKVFDTGSAERAFLLTAADGPDAGKPFVLREYPPHEDDPHRIVQQHLIRRNLERLITSPVLDDDGQPLRSLHMPIAMVTFPQTGSFGCIMPHIDLKDYVSFSELCREQPGADVLCSLCAEISFAFSRLSGGPGLCFGDLNTGHIYCNPKTGEVRILCDDSVGPAHSQIITFGYCLAPEQQHSRHGSDAITNRYLLAGLLFCLLLGVAPVVRFDETRQCTHLEEPPRWNDLPPVLQEHFVRTFVTGGPPADRFCRTTAAQWQQAFRALRRTIVPCPQCGKQVFGESRHRSLCGADPRPIT